MRKKWKLPGNAKQRKVINNLAWSGDIRGAVEMLKLLDPGAAKMKIRLATGDNLRPSRYVR